MKQQKAAVALLLVIAIAVGTLATVAAFFLANDFHKQQPQAANKTSQTRKAEEAANDIRFEENAEIDNIKRRLQLTSNPGQIGFIVLFNDAGQPIMYTGVKGKITSSHKRLTATDYISSGAQGRCEGACGENNVVRAAASDEGTYGTSDAYVYFWTTDDQYIQWSGRYLYSDKPIRLRVEPLVISATTASR
jgi:hypothetical protein